MEEYNQAQGGTNEVMNNTPQLEQSQNKQGRDDDVKNNGRDDMENKGRDGVEENQQWMSNLMENKNPKNVV